MQLFEINFRPAKRRIRGEHQPDVSYYLEADCRLQATVRALHLIEVEHPNYLHVSTRQKDKESAAWLMT